MFSPAGYVSLFELSEEIRRLGFSRFEFLDSCSQIRSVALCSKSLRVAQVSTDLLHQISDGEELVFAFIDEMRWTVSLRRVREAARGMTPDVYVGSRLLLDAGSNGEFVYPFPPEFVEGLVAFEGHRILLSLDEAEKLRTTVRNVSRKPPSPRFKTTWETEQAFIAWINEFPGQKPNEQVRDQWGRDNGVSRFRTRKLWARFKPEDGSKPGPRSKT